MKKAVIFDFDGVIVDSERMHLEAFCLAAVGMGFDRELMGSFEEYAGSADADAYRRLCGRAGRVATAAEFDELSGRKWEVSAGMIDAGRTPVYEGTVRLIREARERVAVAVCSGAGRREIDRMLVAAGLGGVFEIVVSADDVAKAKPDPRGYALTVERLGLRPGECVAIEDTDKGIAAAQGAGIAVVGVCHTLSAARLAGADLVVASSGELTLERLLGV